MSDDKLGNGNIDWGEFQRKYWEAWSAIGRQSLSALSPQKGHSNPWAEALDHWWNAMSDSTPPEISDFYGKLVEQGKAFFRLAEGMTKTLESATSGGHTLMDLQHETEKALAGMKQAFSGSSTEAHDLMRQVMAFWELPLDTWQRTLSSLSVMPGDHLQNLKLEGLERVAETIDERIDRFLSIPGVGYTREWQEQLQEHGRLWLDYQRAFQRYAVGFNELGLKSVERFEQKIKALAGEGKSVGTTRALYDLWVDCCEDVYGEYVATDEYAELHAQLVNTLMQVKRHAGALTDEFLGALNMPTRREVNTLHRRLHETRRESKALAAEIAALKEQMERALQPQRLARETAPAVTADKAQTPRPKRAKAAHTGS